MKQNVCVFFVFLVLVYNNLYSNEFQLGNINKPKFCTYFQNPQIFNKLHLNQNIYYYNYKNQNVIIDNLQDSINIKYNYQSFNIETDVKLTKLNSIENFLILSFKKEGVDKFCVFNLDNQNFHIFDKLDYETNIIGLICNNSIVIIKDEFNTYYYINEKNISQIDTLCNYELNHILKITKFFTFLLVAVI